MQSFPKIPFSLAIADGGAEVAALQGGWNLLEKTNVP
jgi:hypothetical protein